MSVSLRLLALLLLLSAVAPVHAAAGLASLRLTADREILLADGKSTATVTAEARDDRGVAVPDGTTIRFSTTGGRLDTDSAATRNGVARVTLTAADLPGTALVSASIDAGGRFTAAPAQLTLVFATDVEASVSGIAWARVDASEYTGYAADYGLIQAFGKEGTARFEYRGVAIAADTLQIDTAENTVTAVGHVRLSRNGVDREYRTLRYSINDNTGVGEGDEDGRPVPMRVFGPRLDEETPAEPLNPELFVISQIADSQLTITARSMALLPGERLQFRRATFYLNGSKFLSLPFHVLTFGQETLFAEQLIGYGPAGVTVDVPLYYDVRPTAVGTLHVRRGARYGSSAYSVKPGWSLDAEHAYNSGSASDGVLELEGLTREDWSARWTHSQRLDPSTQGRFYVDFPNHRDLYANTLLTRSFKGFTLNASASGTRVAIQDAVTGSNSSGGDWRSQVYAETHARRLPGAPRINYTLNAGVAHQGYFGPATPKPFDSASLGTRLYTSPIPLSKTTTMTNSLSLGQVIKRGGDGSGDGPSILGTVSLSQRLAALGTAGLSYDYTQTPLATSASTGHHRLGATLFMGSGDRWNLALTASHSLDADFGTLFGSLHFGISGPWRGRVNVTGSRFGGFQYQDVEFALIRRIGGRDFAVYYSTTAKRIQFDIAGTRF